MRLSPQTRGLALALALGCALATPARSAFTVPALRAPVTDLAGTLSDATTAALNRALGQMWKQGGSQVAVLIVPGLEGLPLEQASIKVTDAWKLGDKAKDNGVLLLLAMKERKIRIEVGQGLEGALTDAYSRRIIDEQMVPLMREGRADDAVVVGAFAIAAVTDPGFNMRSYLDAPAPRAHGSSSPGARVIIYVILIVLMLGGRVTFGLLGLLFGWPSTRRRGSGWWTTGTGGGFGSGGGFGGGGGFSGGGGGFSGGGASGGW